MKYVFTLKGATDWGLRYTATNADNQVVYYIVMRSPMGIPSLYRATKDWEPSYICKRDNAEPARNRADLYEQPARCLADSHHLWRHFVAGGHTQVPAIHTAAAQESPEKAIAVAEALRHSGIGYAGMMALVASCDIHPSDWEALLLEGES